MRQRLRGGGDGKRQNNYEEEGLVEEGEEVGLMEEGEEVEEGGKSEKMEK